jgi:hypothetical protein
MRMMKKSMSRADNTQHVVVCIFFEAVHDPRKRWGWTAPPQKRLPARGLSFLPPHAKG